MIRLNPTYSGNYYLKGIGIVFLFRKLSVRIGKIWRFNWLLWWGVSVELKISLCFYQLITVNLVDLWASMLMEQSE